MKLRKQTKKQTNTHTHTHKKKNNSTPNKQAKHNPTNELRLS